ncbi:MAG TPA: 4Fe-4S binding protein, partial [Eudoraea sp.]|nr:4Fe-4S binding protein [Eudoraea sp.]
NHGLQALFYQTRTQSSVVDFNNLLKFLGADYFIQGYTEINYKKSNAREVGNLRLGSEPIKAPYLVSKADFVVCDSINFIKKDDALDRIRQGGNLLVASKLSNDQFWQELARDQQDAIIAKNIGIYLIDPGLTRELFVVGTIPFSKLFAGFLTLREPLVQDECLEELKNSIAKIDLARIKQSEGPKREETSDFAGTILGKLIANQGGELPVSAFPVDGTYPTDTSKFNDNGKGGWLPIWDPEACTQCGACSLACPQGVIRMKVFEDERLVDAPAGFKSTKSLEIAGEVDLLNYTIQANPEQCTSCNNCLDVCPSKALKMAERSSVLASEEANWKHFGAIPEFDRSKIDVTKVSQQQLQEPLFKYSSGVDGCGEAPYLKLISQLFGDRMLVANATGASSIFGGALPTTPWSRNKTGRGPAWSNSLFEDNAEFGLGFRLSLDQQELLARELLKKLRPFLEIDFVNDLLTAGQQTEQGIREQQERVDLLKKKLEGIDTPEAKQLGSVADSLVKKSVWIVGGDGWAYDIGYGGLDHVLASGKNVNILVLDNEVYSNTGGQMSKATPMGASAKFAVNGKLKQKKDLGSMAMTYNDVYVASVAIGADQEHTLKAFLEAEQFNGPSLIIAYCHSPSHGIDMNNPSRYHKAAVASGQWLLYRNDPRRLMEDLNPLQLDSVAPRLGVEDYLRLENRFEHLFKAKYAGLELWRRQIQQQVDERFSRYVSMSKPRVSGNARLFHVAKKAERPKSDSTGLSQRKNVTAHLLIFLVFGAQLLFSMSPGGRLKGVDTLNQFHIPTPFERGAGTPFFQKLHFPILRFSGLFKENLQAAGLSQFEKDMPMGTIADLSDLSNSVARPNGAFKNPETLSFTLGH